MVELSDTAGNGVAPTPAVCLRCGSGQHSETTCRARDRMCKKCEQVDPSYARGHFDSVHDLTDTRVRTDVIRLLGPKPFSDWAESKLSPEGLANDCVKIVTKRVVNVPQGEQFENPETFGGSTALLSSSGLYNILKDTHLQNLFLF